jgi:hypothetical protein
LPCHYLWWSIGHCWSVGPVHTHAFGGSSCDDSASWLGHRHVPRDPKLVVGVYLFTLRLTLKESAFALGGSKYFLLRDFARLLARVVVFEGADLDSGGVMLTRERTFAHVHARCLSMHVVRVSA